MPPLFIGAASFCRKPPQRGQAPLWWWGELDIAALVEGQFNKCPYRISSGLAGLVVLGMPSLDDAKSSTLSLIPSLV